MGKRVFQVWSGRNVSAAVLCSLLFACSGGGGGSDGPSTLSPLVVDVPIGGRTQFTLSPAQAATWSVDGVPGGNDEVGRISWIGSYTAPFVIPGASTAVPPGPDPDPTVLIAASTASNTATVTLVRRFIDDGAVDICVSLPPPLCKPSAVIAPDLDGNGFSDLVTANAGNGTISVVLRNGASDFFAPEPWTIGTSATAEPQALVAGLFDGNPGLDLVIADADSSAPAIWAWLNYSNGAFDTSPPPVGLPLWSRPLSIGAGRFNNDNFRDVVVADFFNDTVSILLGSGEGTFPTQTPLSSAGLSPLGVAVADFNGDLFDDIAVANNGSETVSVFLANSNGSGGFGPEQPYPVSGGPSAIVATDLNVDGFPDLAVTTVSGGLVLIMNKGTPSDPETFQPPAQTDLTGAEPVAVAAGDVNQDQFADLVVVNKADNTLVVYLGHGDGTLTVSETYAVGTLPLSVAVGDFNGDAWPDLAVANSGADTVTILRNRGS